MFGGCAGKSPQTFATFSTCAGPSGATIVQVKCHTSPALNVVSFLFGSTRVIADWHFGSVRVTFASVTLPVFVALNEYVNVEPAAAVTAPVFSSTTAGAGVVPGGGTVYVWSSSSQTFFVGEPGVTWSPQTLATLWT